MGRYSTYKCDAPGCTQLKKQANHWYTFISDKNSGCFTCFPIEKHEDALDVPLQEGVVVGTLCSHGCEQKVIESHLRMLDVDELIVQPMTTLASAGATSHVDNTDEPT